MGHDLISARLHCIKHECSQVGNLITMAEITRTIKLTFLGSESDSIIKKAKLVAAELTELIAL